MTLVHAASANPFAVDPRAVHRKVARESYPCLLSLCHRVPRPGEPRLRDGRRHGQGLEFSPAVFGWGGGLFYAGYLLLEIPGALLVERWSARKWFARILVTWGFCSMSMALVRTPGQFYLTRFLLGLAEAGFFPGIIVYFTHWFPRAQRGRAIAGLVLGVPVSARSSWEHARVGLADEGRFVGFGWVAVGVHRRRLAGGADGGGNHSSDGPPRRTQWLTPAEREWLEQTLEEERRAAAAAGGHAPRKRCAPDRRSGFWRSRDVAANTGGYAIQLWLPRSVEAALADDAGLGDVAAVFDWMTLIYACGVAGVWLSGRSSHRFGEWKWHAVAGGIDRRISGGERHAWPVVECGLRLALPGRLLLRLLAVAVLGAADAVSVGLDGGGGDRLHQHLRPTSPACLANRSSATFPDSRLGRSRLSALACGLLRCGRLDHRLSWRTQIEA